MLSSQKFGEELQKILNKSYDVVKIARWAEHIYASHCRELSDELNDITMALSSMEHGPEFEYSELELKLLAEKLIKDEKNPLKQINEMKSKENFPPS